MDLEDLDSKDACNLLNMLTDEPVGHIWATGHDLSVVII